MRSGFIAVHTGAGNQVDERKYQRVIKEACTKANNVFKSNGSAMDACETAIMTLENCIHTNAGLGSNLTWNGQVECEASIMNGSNLEFGACTNVSTVKNPIQLARRICDRQSYMLPFDRIPPMVMAGKGADRYAKELGCDTVTSLDLITSKALLTYNHYKNKFNELESGYDTSGLPLEFATKEVSLDTVGAVAVDSQGQVAAGCSSGGILLKLSGRVGQAATYGAGCWAQMVDDTSVGTCTTGNGEFLMKTQLAKEICESLYKTDCCATSLNDTFKTKFLDSPFLPKSQEIYGGAITLVYSPKSLSGELLWSHTTKSFCIGYMSTQQRMPKFVFSPLPTYCTPGKSNVVNGHSFHFS